MIVVKDEDTLGQALQLLEKEEAVRYSDHYSYRTIKVTDTLQTLCNEAFGRGEIVLVASLDEVLPAYEEVWRAHKATLKALRKEENKKIRAWVREHPKEARTMMRRKS